MRKYPVNNVINRKFSLLLRKISIFMLIFLFVSYLSKFSLANHIRSVHLKKYHKICDLCGESISGKSRFKRHMLEHEGKPPPPVTCEVCGRRLADMKCLKRHMNSHHPPDGVKREYNCPICPKVFASPSNVKMHIKVVHENSYERKCTLCEKTFKRPDALKVFIDFFDILCYFINICICFTFFRIIWLNILVNLYMLVAFVQKRFIRMVKCMHIAKESILWNGKNRYVKNFPEIYQKNILQNQ